MMNLREFVRPDQPIRNAWVSYRGMRSLYVRKGPVLLRIQGRSLWCDCITIASAEAISPGNGTLKRLVAELLKQDRAIYAENVLSDRLVDGLRRMGFIAVDTHIYYEGLPCLAINYEAHSHEAETCQADQRQASR